MRLGSHVIGLDSAFDLQEGISYNDVSCHLERCQLVSPILTVVNSRMRVPSHPSLEVLEAGSLGYGDRAFAFSVSSDLPTRGHRCRRDDRTKDTLHTEKESKNKTGLEQSLDGECSHQQAKKPATRHGHLVTTPKGPEELS